MVFAFLAWPCTGRPKHTSDSTIGLLSVYLHPQTKVAELKDLIAWVKTSKVDFRLYMGGDFNQVDASCPDLWNELLVHAQVLDTHPQLHTFESPTGSSALDRILCPTDYIAAAQIDVIVAANRRHHLSGHSPGGGCGPPRGMCLRGGGGPVRVRGDVKLRYSAGELLKAPVPNEP